VIITLWGGPHDGREYAVSDQVWRSGVWLMPVASPLPVGEAGLRQASMMLARYLRVRVDPGWLCALPLHRWQFEGVEPWRLGVCGAVRPGVWSYMCTRPFGHPGEQHEAIVDGVRVAVWPRLTGPAGPRAAG
jgi:hypothetical protein